jgi:hypothetical protein
MSAEEAILLQELQWRMKCQESLIEYARTIPIPGVPQTDNIEELIEKGFWERDHTTDLYDGSDLIPLINTALAEHHILMLQALEDMVYGKLIGPEGEVCRRVMLTRISQVHLCKRSVPHMGHGQVLQLPDHPHRVR